MNLSDPAIKIVTVHASGTIRTLINSELRNRGFQDVVGAPDLQTVIGILETGLIHWLITPVIMDDKINVFQILQLITEDPSMMNMRISFITDDKIDPLKLTKSFDMGLLSCHSKMQSKADVEEEMRVLFDYDKLYAGNNSLVAAEYLRKILRESGHLTELLRFEKSLFQLNLGNIPLLLHLAEAYLCNKLLEQAQTLFSQALVVDPGLKVQIDALKARYPELAYNASTEPAPDSHNVLGLSTCLLIEPDATVMEQVKELLKQLGVKDIYAFADPLLSLQWLEKKIVPELILFEWRLAQIPGPIFVQKIRDALGFGLPVSVMNKDLTERDMPILHEMGVTDRVRKPIEPQAFFQDVIWVINQDRVPTEPLVLVQKIRQAMADQNFEKMAAYTKRYIESDKPSEAEKTLLQAEIAYFRGNYPSAKNLALSSLKAGLASVGVMSLLGKALMKMRDFESALRCLENAEVVSPANVKRICNIAETHLEMGDRESFEEKLDEAKELVPESQEILEVETKAALVDGDSGKARDLVKSLDSLLSIVTFTNNRAIALIRTDRFDEGIELYKEAIEAVPPQRTEILSILFYNLGLALARLNRLDEAQKELIHAATQKNEKLRNKIGSLKLKIKKTLEEGGKLELYTVSGKPAGDQASADPQKDFEELMMALKINPGDLCCHKIFFETQLDEAFKEAIHRPLRFKKRTTIQRSAPKAS